MMYVVLAVFILTYALLIFRRIGRRIVLPAWSSMAIGALLMVATFSISPLEALESIDFRVIAFLFGILVITSGFVKSGLIEYLVVSVLMRARNFDRLLFGVVFGAGLLSAFLLNDGVALLITPLVLGISLKVGVKNPRGFLLPLAFGITTGSVITPIGNPQNLLVALNSGISTPFLNFVAYLLLPSLLSLLAVFVLCRVFFKREYLLAREELGNSKGLPETSKLITDPVLARQSSIVLLVLLVSVIVIEIFPALQSLGLSLANITFGFGLILLIISRQRLRLLREISWGILIFFAGMFVVMRAVWDSNIGSTLLSALPTPNPASRVQSVGAIMLNSVLLSQILSNVPFVQLYSYEMHALGLNGVIQWLALAAGSTLAGNLTLLGAVSNIIIIDSAEGKGSKAFSFFEFLKYGLVITLVTCLIFFVFLVLGI